MNFEPLLRQIREAEGFSAVPYRCPAGKLTVGYGTNIENISREEAELLLNHRLMVVVREVHARWPWIEDLDEARRRAIYDMAYNLGVPRLAGFSKMFRALALRDFKSAADEARNSRWFGQVGRRGRFIADLIEKGEVHENAD